MKKISDSLNIQLGTILSFATLFANILIYIFYTPFLLNIVGDKQYGIYSFTLGITTWFSFAISSISVGYVKFNATSKGKDSKYNSKTVNGCYFLLFLFYTLLVLIAGCIFVALLTSRVIVFDKYTQDEQNLICVMFIITILSLIPTLLFHVFSSSVFANGKFIWYRSSLLLNLLLRTAISIPFLLMGFGIVSVLTIHCVVNVALAAADFFYAYFGLKIRFSFKTIKEHKYLFKDIFFFTGALLINEIADKLNSSVDSLVLGSTGYAVELAHYSLGMRIAEYSSQAILTISKNLAPTIHNNVVLKKHEENKKLFNNISRIQVILMALLIGGFAVCGKEFINLWLGKGYEDVYVVCLVLMILYSYMATTIMTQDIERANNKHLGRSLIILGTVLLNAILTVVFVKFFPSDKVIYGCLLGTAIGIIIGYCIILSIYHKKSVDMPMGSYWFFVLKIALLVFPGVIICLNLNLIFPLIESNSIISFLAKGFVFIVLFVTLIALFNRDQLKNIIGKFKNRRKTNV